MAPNVSAILKIRLSLRRRVGEIQPGDRMSMQMIEGWTIYRDFPFCKGVVQVFN